MLPVKNRSSQTFTAWLLAGVHLFNYFNAAASILSRRNLKFPLGLKKFH